MRLLILFALCCILGGCMYSGQFICGERNTTTMKPDKTTTTSTEVQGNVPLNGGTVSNPNQTMQK